MQTATLLPRLELLTIHAAYLASNRCLGQSNLNTMVHEIDTSTQIDRHVMSYGPLDPSKYKFTIKHKRKYYTL
ncbi:hypothetical protein BDQ17DRAFT_1107512 [Cyathus striatus]|nr:hypothetical protein BDQ17DRAFT_1107512 [Cyathus striatus]